MCSGLMRLHGRLARRARAEPTADEADEVHEAVPAHLERAVAEQRPDRQRHGIELGIGKQMSPAGDCDAG